MAGAIVPSHRGTPSTWSLPKPVSDVLQKIFTRQVTEFLITGAIPITIGLLVGRVVFIYVSNMGGSLFDSLVCGVGGFCPAFLVAHVILYKLYLRHQGYQYKLKEIDEIVQRVVQTEEHFNKRVTEKCFLIRNELGLFNKEGQLLNHPIKFTVAASKSVPIWILNRIKSQLNGNSYHVSSDRDLQPKLQSTYAIRSLKETGIKTVLSQLQTHLETRPIHRKEAFSTYALTFENTRYSIEVVELKEGVTRYVIKYPKNLPAAVVRVLNLMAANASSGFFETKTSACD